MRRSQPLLGTYVTITAYGADSTRLDLAVSAAFDEFRRIDAVMSAHRPDSELSRLNARAAREPVAVSPDLFGAIAQAQAIARATDGAFDVTVRPLVDLWGFLWRDYRRPNAAEIAAVLPRIGYRKLELDAAARAVRFGAPGGAIDLGGIGKGYAVDCAIARLRACGVSNAMVKAGGDLRVAGTPPGARAWTVQLEDPRKRGARVRVRLRDAALSTSGNYENYFELEGRRYSHILDPRTGWPVSGVAACTVVAPTCTQSDAWATACFVLGAEPSLARFGGRLAIRFTLPPEDARGASWRVRQTCQFPALERAGAFPPR